MSISCVWEHNGDDTILYALEYPGAYTRGENLDAAMEKMALELRSYAGWLSLDLEEPEEIVIVQDSPCTLSVRDADSDVLFAQERQPLTPSEYEQLKAAALKSAADFLALYEAIPDKNRYSRPSRSTFYGQVPRTAEEMYQHTKNVNSYYFGEIGVPADNDGTILDCRLRGFALLEQQPDFLRNGAFAGSYGEYWSLRKVLRRFLWHDRIHARAMYRMASQLWEVANVFGFQR